MGDIPMGYIMDYNKFLDIQQKMLPSLNVSRETFDQLRVYLSLLEEQNKNLNLVGSQEMERIWERHVFDSMQLMLYLKKPPLSLCDVGSGAGFPSIVLGILGVDKMTLVESIEKKARFLMNVSRETSVKNTIICDRVENLKKVFDVIVARAVAPLKELLILTKNIRTSRTVHIFPKGKKYQEEIEDARAHFSFEVDVHQSVTHPEGRILVIHHVS